MKIYQLVPDLCYGDGVGNDITAIDSLIKRLGIDTCVFAYKIDDRKKDICRYIEKMPKIEEDDIVIYHFAVDSGITDLIKKLKCKKILRYHNVTPAKFFYNYNTDAAMLCKKSRVRLEELCNEFMYCIPVSEYNKKELVKMGFECEMKVIPILIPFDDYKKRPDEKLCNDLRDGKKNIIFTGRIVPNKCQQDLIKVFYYLHKYYDKNIRLSLVGNYSKEDKYYQELKEYAEELGVEVNFTGHISFAQILSYYSTADLFLCMSEHEGFCIPLVEAMFFKIPIVAYDAAAVKGTLGENSITVKEKKHVEIAGLCEKILRDQQLRDRIIEAQNEQFNNYLTDKVEKEVAAVLKTIIEY